MICYCFKAMVHFDIAHLFIALDTRQLLANPYVLHLGGMQLGRMHLGGMQSFEIRKAEIKLN